MNLPEAGGQSPVAPEGSRAVESSDFELIEEARRLIEARYVENRHHIAAVLRTKSGKIYYGLHLDTYVGRASVCAEAAAISQALEAGDNSIARIVSVRHPRPSEEHREPQIVAPCGICREMLCDFAPEAEVILPTEAGPRRMPVAKLLPMKYRRQP